MKTLNKLGLTAALLSTAVAGAQTFKVECENNIRAHVTKTQIVFNDQQDYISYSFVYEYKYDDLGPKQAFGVIQNGADDLYPVVAKVDVWVTKDDVFVNARSELVGGRNPHLKTLELDLMKYGENKYFAEALIINRVDYKGYVGGCKFLAL